MVGLDKTHSVWAVLAYASVALSACGAPSEPGCPADAHCDDYDITGHHSLVVATDVRYTVGAPVVGAVVHVEVVPPAGAVTGTQVFVDTTSDVGGAGGWVSFYSLTTGQAHITVTVTPRPPFDLPVTVTADSVAINSIPKYGGAWSRRITVLYPPHLPPTP
jgi:hypothetical protein